MDLKFELGSLYQLEKSIKGFLLSTLNVRELSDIRRNALKAANKDIAVDLAMTLASMLDRSVELLRSASADLDCMKREQLESQSKLLKVQDELSVKKSDQLDAVKNTVEEKMSSWAAVVKKNSGTNKVSQKEMKKAVKCAINESDREYNVVMFNVEEQEEEDPSETYDVDTALDIMNSAGLVAVEGEGRFTAERIGTFDKDKKRPLKVKFDFKSMAFSLLAKAKNLKDNEEYGQVFIVPDRSREERIEHRKLVEQLKLIRTQNPEKRCYIWNKAIHKEDC